MKTLSGLGLLGSCLLLLACDAQSPEAPTNQNITLINGWPVFDAKPSGRANQGVIEQGEFVGTDEIHFARGANADGLDHEQYYATDGEPPEPMPAPVESDDVYRHSTWGAFGTDRAAHNGDYLLPTDTTRWPDFTADIGFLRFEADSEFLYLQLRFLSFPAPEAQIATLTFTSSASTPALNPWPRNAGISSRYDVAMTLWADDAELQDQRPSATRATPQSLIALGGAVRITDHAFEARVPLSALPTGVWRVGVGAGLAAPNDASQYWTVPAGTPTTTSPATDSPNRPGSNVWDLMFTPHDPEYHDDHIQARLLTDGDVSAATVELNPVFLQARASVPAPVITGRIAHNL